MRMDRRAALALCASALTLGAPLPRRRAMAQSYPDRPVKIVSPYPPGGPYDQIPRLVADFIGRRQGWTVMIDNRPGASGIIGVALAKAAPADGYTLVVTSSSTHGSEPALRRSLPYDPYKDLAPIILLADAALALLVRKEMKATNVAELIALIRARPGRLKFSSAGHATQQHLAAAMMLQRAGLPADAAIHVPYQGLPPAFTALLSGDVDFMIVSTGPAKAYIENGDLRVLAITSPSRSPGLPNTPAMAEIFPGFQIFAWCGLAAPAATPQPILDRWNALANEALADLATRKAVDAMDYTPRGGAAADYTAFFTHDIANYKQLADATGLTDD